MASLGVQELGRWFEQESHALVLYARPWLDAAAAEDVVQDVFVNLAQQSPPPAHVKAWLYQAVRNQAFKRLRSESRRGHRENRVATETAGWFEPRPGDGLDAHAAEAALRRLPEDEREIVTLRLWGGLTLEEIAIVLSMSVATVFRRYRTGIESIRNQLEESWTATTL